MKTVYRVGQFAGTNYRLVIAEITIVKETEKLVFFSGNRESATGYLSRMDKTVAEKTFSRTPEEAVDKYINSRREAITTLKQQIENQGKWIDEALRLL